jgi:hypothetical protein
MLLRKARSFVWRSRQLYLPEQVCSRNGVLEAELFDAGFSHGDSCYNALHRAANGKIYFAIGSWRSDTAARLFSFDESSHSLSTVGDFDAAVGARPNEAIPQGKVHVEFAEWDRRLYTATHVGFYNTKKRIETPGKIPGRLPYQGGFFLAFDSANSSFTPLSKAPQEEGIIAMAADRARESLYGLSWPSGLFLMSGTKPCEVQSFPSVFGQGERGAPRDGSWSRICRSIGLDPRSGDVYWSDSDGRIFVFRRNSNKIELVASKALGLDGEPSMWRKVVWNAKANAFYGILARTAQLFRFDPADGRVEPLAVLRPEGWRGAAWWQVTPQATLAFHVSDDGETIRYLATGPGAILQDGRREDGRRVRATLSYFSYHIPSGSVRCHGLVRMADGRYPTQAQSLLASGGELYTVAWIELPANSPCRRTSDLRKVRREVQVPQLHGAIEEVNLIRFRDPIATP